jgi:protein involved in polysaccharide export with SLBB domain
MPVQLAEFVHKTGPEFDLLLLHKFVGRGGVSRARLHCVLDRIETRLMKKARKLGQHFRTFALASAVCVAALPVSAQQSPINPNALVSTYRIQVGDMLRLRLFTGGSEISGGIAASGVAINDYPVEESGMVFLPRIGGVMAVGKTPEELRREVREAYSKVYPESSVSVTAIFLVSVLGAVRAPATVDANPNMTVFDAIARAGGFQPDANREKIELLRSGQTIVIDATGASGGQSLTTYLLQSGDKIVVPTRHRWTAQALLTIVQLIGLGVTIYAVTKD